jgi:signal transduction histidine kinase
MRLGLRWKILLVTLLTPLTLGLATWRFVEKRVTAHVNSSSIHESLEHSQAVFESMLRTRGRELAGTARVIARDPRFFSLIMLRSSQRDTRFVATVRGMARDFQRINEADLFEVFDAEGARLASVGAMSTSRTARQALVRRALRGEEVTGILVDGNVHFQVAVLPVTADDRTVGALMIGSGIDRRLARQLRSQMRCDVTFVSGRTVTGTTLSAPGDLETLVARLADLGSSPGDLDNSGVIQVATREDVYLTLVRRIPTSDPAGRQLYVLQRSYDPESIFLKTMEEVLLMLAMIAAAVALLTGWLFSEQILRPIQSLVRGAQEMERGNYGYPVKVRTGDEIGYLAQRFVDMRQRERAYVESLEQTTRLKSEFIRLASVELRSPLSVITGYRDLLAAGGLGPINEQQDRALEVMRSSLDRLGRFADEALEFARLKGDRLSLSIGPCDVPTMLRQAIGQAISQGSAHSVRVDLECDPFERSVPVDGAALGRALAHLIANAVRFTPAGGRVVVRARERGDRLRLEVEDSGVGVAPERLSELLTRWLPMPPDLPQPATAGLGFNEPGLGLGLPTARAIAEAHGGTLEALSEPGKGSTFILEVPLGKSSAESPARDAA